MDIKNNLEINKFSWEDNELYYSINSKANSEIRKCKNEKEAMEKVNDIFKKVDDIILTKLNISKKQIKKIISENANGEIQNHFFANGADIRSFIEEAINNK
jgi:hypothetical protein